MHLSSPSSAPCPTCAGTDALRALAAALARDDLDAALALGLLDYSASGAALCAHCAAQQAQVLAARDARQRALAARERYRAREARLAARAEAKAQRRGGHVPAAAALPEVTTDKPATPDADPAKPAALPPTAAAALARAKAKAAAKRGGSSPAA